MKAIRFVHDWNGKLTGPQKIFTTIRMYDNPTNESYYLRSLGETFMVQLLKNKEFVEVGEARLIGVNTMSYKTIPYALLRVDTGIEDTDEIDHLFEKFGIGYDDQAIVLVFEKQGGSK